MNLLVHSGVCCRVRAWTTLTGEYGGGRWTAQTWQSYWKKASTQTAHQASGHLIPSTTLMIHLRKSPTPPARASHITHSLYGTEFLPNSLFYLWSAHLFKVTISYLVPLSLSDNEPVSFRRHQPYWLFVHFLWHISWPKLSKCHHTRHGDVSSRWHYHSTCK